MRKEEEKTMKLIRPMPSTLLCSSCCLTFALGAALAAMTLAGTAPRTGHTPCLYPEAPVAVLSL